MLPDPLGSIAKDDHPPQDSLLTTAVGVHTAPADDVQRPTPRGFGPQTRRKASGCLARGNVAGIHQLAVLPGADQAQLDLVPVPFDQRAVQSAITIARHHAIGLHDQRLALCHWGILGRRFLRALHLRHGGPLFAFEFGTGSLSMGPQRFDAHVHPSQGFEQLSRLSECGQASQQCFPVLQTATGALFYSHTQHRLEWQPAMPTPTATQADTRNMHAAAATVHGARFTPPSHRIQ